MAEWVTDLRIRSIPWSTALVTVDREKKITAGAPRVSRFLARAELSPKMSRIMGPARTPMPTEQGMAISMLNFTVSRIFF